MEANKTQLDGVIEFLPEPFVDHRGVYVELYNQKHYSEQGAPAFIQDDISMSHRHVLRGLHGDAETWKLITCLLGELYFVVLDVREGSAQFGKWQSFLLSERNYRQILVPPGFANGHLVISERAIFHYKQTTYYSKNQFSVRWNDPKYAIWWPVKAPILSQRDEAGRYVD